jgi:hypothetical protein
MNNKTFSRGKVGSHQKTNRAAIGRALHKHNKKRFQWAAIRKDETASFEALKDEDQEAQVPHKEINAPKF